MHFHFGKAPIMVGYTLSRTPVTNTSLEKLLRGIQGSEQAFVTFDADLYKDAIAATVVLCENTGSLKMSWWENAFTPLSATVRANVDSGVMLIYNEGISEILHYFKSSKPQWVASAGDDVVAIGSDMGAVLEEALTYDQPVDELRFTYFHPAPKGFKQYQNTVPIVKVKKVVDVAEPMAVQPIGGAGETVVLGKLEVTVPTQPPAQTRPTFLNNR